MRHHFAFTLTNQLALGQAVRWPNAETDLMTNMQWCYETNLFATEALAEILDIELPTIDQPEPVGSRASTPISHMADVLRNLPAEDEWLRYRLRTLFRTARHALRADEVGEQESARTTSTTCSSCWGSGRPMVRGRGRPRVVRGGRRRHGRPRRGAVAAVPQAQPAGPHPARPPGQRHGDPSPHPDVPLIHETGPSPLLRSDGTSLCVPPAHPPGASPAPRVPHPPPGVDGPNCQSQSRDGIPQLPSFSIFVDYPERVFATLPACPMSSSPPSNPPNRRPMGT